MISRVSNHSSRRVSSKLRTLHNKNDICELSASETCVHEHTRNVCVSVSMLMVDLHVLVRNGRLEIVSGNRNYYIYAKKYVPANIAAYWKMRYFT